MDDKEQRLIQNMQNVLKEKMIKDYKKGETKRDAHPKHLGILKGEFIVEPNLPDKLKSGVFSEVKSYPCVVRVSNSKGSVQSDTVKDFRGFAIKLLETTGERANEDEKQTQDFLLMSKPIMPLGTVQLFHDAVIFLVKYHPILLLLKCIFTGNMKALKELEIGKYNDTSPLDIDYWSTTPFRFGEYSVKYKIFSTSSYKSALPTDMSDDYLTQNMASHLTTHEATFDFLVQFYMNDEVTPIEDAGIEWHEKNSSFIKLATLVIPIQEIRTKEREEWAELLSFSPGNSLKAHEAIGGINRARTIIYKHLSDFRHERNNTKVFEPKRSDLENLS